MRHSVTRRSDFMDHESGLQDGSQKVMDLLGKLRSDLDGKVGGILVWSNMTDLKSYGIRLKATA